MPAVFSRLKNWVAEKLTYADLNAEIDNILDNFEPAQMDDYSANTTVMRQQTDPGEVGTESPATTLAGELERIRYALKEAKGTTYWYQSPASSIASIFDQLGSTTLATRIVSGKVRTGSSQSDWLRADGGGVTGTLSGSVTNFVYQINSTEYTISTNPQVTGLSTAPNSNNTALVDDAGVNDTEDTKYLGEFGSSLIVDNMGTEIVGLVGKYAVFKINNGVTNEYFMAYVKSSTELTQITRGAFFDTSGNPVPRVAIANNDTITLLKANWIFAKTDGTLTFSTGFPRVTPDTPSGAAANDYWFDTTNEIWKKYDGASFVDAEACLVGLILCDDTNSVASLSFDVSKELSDTNTLQLERISNTEVRAVSTGGRISVFGSLVDFGTDLPRWDMANDLDSGITEAASTEYFLYLDEDGEPIISDLAPRDLTGTRRGLYHPHHTWRCVGSLWNDASSNIEQVIDYNAESPQKLYLINAVASNALTVRALRQPNLLFQIPNGASVPLLPGTSLTVSSGSTLGTLDATDHNLVISGVQYSGRLELALSNDITYEPGESITTTAEGGAGGADSFNTIYSKAARSSVPILPLSKAMSNQTTAGTWAAVLTGLKFWPFLANGKVQLTEFTSSGTWTKPAKLKQAIVISVGGGGGGGGVDMGATSYNKGGGGGGSGATCVEVFEASELSATETVTCGSAGSAGASSGTSGGSGGNTTFGSYHTAGGGGGGTGSSTNTNGSHRGGAGGTASNADLNFTGTAGGVGDSGGGLGTGGPGAPSFFGGGGQPGAVTNPGVSAGSAGTIGSGGGGGTAYNDTTGAAGGAGGTGYVLVIEILED